MQGHNYNWIASDPLDSFDEDFDDYEIVLPKAYRLKGDTVLGNDVGIGAESMIMPGIKIADGASSRSKKLSNKKYRSL
ncbi:hypothetical protein O6R16_05535 [Candidatus Rickettsia tasmanensis]